MKALKLTFVGIILLLIILIAVANWAVSKIASAEFVTEQIHTALPHLRADIGAVNASVYSPVAALEILEFTLAPKDADHAPIKFGKVRVALSLLDLVFNQRVSVSGILLQDTDLKITLYEDGSNSMSKMFGVQPQADASTAAAGPAFNARNLPITASVRDVELRNLNIDLTVEKNAALIRLQQTNLELDQIGINPDNLAEFNHAELQLDGTITLDSATQENLRYADLAFAGPISVEVFDIQTGNVDPNITTAIKLTSSAHLSPQIPAVKKAFDLVRGLQQFGLDLGTLPEQITFDPKQQVAVNYHRGKLTLIEPFNLQLGDWNLDIAKQGWINIATDTHHLAAQLTASEALSRTLLAQLDSGLTRAPKEIRTVLAASLKQNWFENERFVSKLHSRDSLTRPSVNVENIFPDPKELLLQGGKAKATEMINEQLEEKLEEKLGEKTRGLLRGILDK